MSTTMANNANYTCINAFSVTFHRFIAIIDKSESIGRWMLSDILSFTEFGKMVIPKRITVHMYIVTPTVQYQEQNNINDDNVSHHLTEILMTKFWWSNLDKMKTCTNNDHLLSISLVVKIFIGSAKVNKFDDGGRRIYWRIIVRYFVLVEDFAVFNQTVKHFLIEKPYLSKQHLDVADGR